LIKPNIFPRNDTYVLKTLEYNQKKSLERKLAFVHGFEFRSSFDLLPVFIFKRLQLKDMEVNFAISFQLILRYSFLQLFAPNWASSKTDYHNTQLASVYLGLRDPSSFAPDGKFVNMKMER